LSPAARAGTLSIMDARLPLTLLSAFAIPLVLLAFVASRDPRPHARAPWMAATFVGGMVAAAVAYFAFEALGLLPEYQALVGGTDHEHADRLVFSLAVVGPLEETLKLAAVVLALRARRGPLEPADALVFTAAAALGFGAAENWYAMYATGGPDAGRAAVIPFLHLGFSAFTGWGLARSVTSRLRPQPVWTGLALAAACHGLYDVLVDQGGPWRLATLPLVALLWVFLTRSLRDFTRVPLFPQPGRTAEAEWRGPRRS
jgi:RsiW-degrading membrane proteinase PrsW (M82 family)